MNARTKNQPDIFEIDGDMARERTTLKSPDLSTHPCINSTHSKCRKVGEFSSAGQNFQKCTYLIHFEHFLKSTGKRSFELYFSTEGSYDTF